MKNIRSILLSALPITLLLIYLLIGSLSFKASEHDYCTNPDSLIAAQINTHKVIMLGESPHNDYVLYNALINVIQNWIIISEKDKQNEFILNLVLEMDSLSASTVDEYVRTGNDSLFRMKIIPHNSFEACECFVNLRRTKKKIDSLNLSRQNMISLNILGFEEDAIETNGVHFRKTQSETELWFVNERDKNFSAKIIEYINTHSSSNHYLMQYGAAHLRSGYVDKNLGFSIPDEQCFGYYACHYLREEFGNENVLTYFPWMYLKERLDGTFLEKYRDQSVILPSDEFPVKGIEADSFSYQVVRPWHCRDSHFFSLAFSKFIVEKFSEEIEVYEKYLPGFFAARTYNRNLLYIQLITGIKFESSMQLKAWLKTDPNIDGLARFDSNEFSDFIYDIYSNKITLTDNRRTIMLLNLPDRDSAFYPSDPLVWHTNWKDFNSKAKFINCIGIYWAGYPDEKIKAKQYLKEYSGVDYFEPEKYLQWYRERYCR